MNKFIDFLYSSDGEDIQEVRRDVESYGVDVARVERRVGEILSRLDTVHKLDWLSRAREKQARFDARVRAQARELRSRFKSSKELIDAALSGSLGPTMQTQAGVFFRNRDDRSLSEADLRSIIEDCMLLDDNERE